MILSSSESEDEESSSDEGQQEEKETPRTPVMEFYFSDEAMKILKENLTTEQFKIVNAGFNTQRGATKEAEYQQEIERSKHHDEIKKKYKVQIKKPSDLDKGLHVTDARIEEILKNAPHCPVMRNGITKKYFNGWFGLVRKKKRKWRKTCSCLSWMLSFKWNLDFQKCERKGIPHQRAF